MSVLEKQIKATLLPGMTLPDEFSQLFKWIEDNGFYVDSDDDRVGMLFPEDELKAGWTDTERPGGTYIEFAAAGNANVHYWIGHDRPEVINRICVFARTGEEGSEAGFWIDDNGNQRIVHMGSGSGSVLCCVLGDTPLDFLRLLAIGYDEICWNDEFPYSPNAPEQNRDLFIHPNIKYQDWIKSTFNVDIPACALDIVKHPAEMGDTDTPDDFCQWVNQHIG